MTLAADEVIRLRSLARPSSHGRDRGHLSSAVAPALALRSRRPMRLVPGQAALSSQPPTPRCLRHRRRPSGRGSQGRRRARAPALLRAGPRAQGRAITTDGFLYPNAVLEHEGLDGSQGSPKATTLPALLGFLSEHQGRAPAGPGAGLCPSVYDVMLHSLVEIDRPGDPIVDGLNVLQKTRPPCPERKEIRFVSYFFPISLSISTPTGRAQAMGRPALPGVALREPAFRDPSPISTAIRGSPTTKPSPPRPRAGYDHLVNLHDKSLPTPPARRLILQ